MYAQLSRAYAIAFSRSAQWVMRSLPREENMHMERL